MADRVNEIQIEDSQDKPKGAVPRGGWSATLRPDADRYRRGIDGHLIEFDDDPMFFARVPKHVRRAGYRRSDPFAAFKGRR